MEMVRMRLADRGAHCDCPCCGYVGFGWAGYEARIGTCRDWPSDIYECPNCLAVVTRGDLQIETWGNF